jgi:hypothetical protein
LRFSAALGLGAGVTGKTHESTGSPKRAIAGKPAGWVKEVLLMKTIPYLALVWLLSLACALTAAPVAGASVNVLHTQTGIPDATNTVTPVPTLNSSVR